MEAPFRLGKKLIYLPNIVFTLLRNHRLLPTQAVFKVPITGFLFTY